MSPDRPDNGSSDPKLHTNPDWLREKYNDEGMSLNAIADLVDKSYTTVWRQFDKHGIERRDNANHVDMTSELRAFLDGLLAGDGCLAAENRAAGYLHGDSYKEFIDWLEEALESHGIETISRWSSEGDNWTAYHLKTRAYRELMGVEGRWYAQREKRLPSDFELTPTTLLMWYVGDGSYIPQKHGANNVVLYSDKFSEASKRVKDTFRRDVGIDVSYMQKGVYVPVDDHDTFFEYMSESEYRPDGYERKFP